jgi:hypothetical protein
MIKIEKSTSSLSFREENPLSFSSLKGFRPKIGEVVKENKSILTSKKWFISYPKSALQAYFRNKQIAFLKKKLDGGPLSAAKMLKPQEVIKILTLVKHWLDPNEKSHSLSTEEKDFLSHLQTYNYLPKEDKLEPIKEQILAELDKYLVNLHKMDFSAKAAKQSGLILFKPNLLRANFSSVILFPISGSTVLSFSKEEFVSLASLTTKNIEDKGIKLNALKTLRSILRFPQMALKYAQMASYHDLVPFLVGDELVYWGNMSNFFKEKGIELSSSTLCHLFEALPTIQSEFKNAKAISKLCQQMENHSLDLTSIIFLLKLTIKTKLSFSLPDDIQEEELESKRTKDLLFLLNTISSVWANSNSILSTYFPSEKLMRAIGKMQKISEAQQAGQLQHLKKQDKLTASEYFVFQRFEPLLRQLTNFAPSLLQVLEDFDQLSGRKKSAPFIHVCFTSTSYNSLANSNDPLLKKIISKIEFLIYSVIAPYGHANFLHYDGQEFTKHGLQGIGIYHSKISGRRLPQFKEYQINVSKLMPKSLDPEQKPVFEDYFFKELSALMAKENKTVFSSSRLRALQKVFASSLQFGKIRPENVGVGNETELFCAQFVCETIIEAQVNVCKKLGITPPQDLNFFGLYSRENLKHLTPCRLLNAFVKKDILQKVGDILTE